MNRNTGMTAGQIIGTMGGKQVIGVDIAKHVFQLHTVTSVTISGMTGHDPPEYPADLAEGGGSIRKSAEFGGIKGKAGEQRGGANQYCGACQKFCV